jgi:dihydrofolate reductase
VKLTVTEFLTLDGVSQGPGAPDEDTSGGFDRGGWFVPFVDEEFVELAAQWLAEADGLLFGRRTYDNFSRDWPKMADGDNPFAATMNSLPKYVASHSLRSAEHWSPTTILSGDIVAQVAELKRQPGRELQIHGSAELAQPLLAAGLIDVLRLVVAPVVVGTGRRLLPVGGAPVGLRITRHQVTAAGLAVLTYEPAGQPVYATYEP